MERFLIEVIEDNQETRQSLVDLAQEMAKRVQAPIDVQAHATLQAALADGDLDTAAMIILDLGLPGFKDAEALECLREVVRPTGQVVVFTGNTDQALAEKIRSQGDDLMIKGAVGARELLAAMKSAILKNLDREIKELSINVA